MRVWLSLAIVMFGLGLVMLACSNDDDDDCQCDDDADDDVDDDADDDTTSADDDTGGLGTGQGSQECLNALKPPFEECSAVCDEVIDDMCAYYHCLFGCFESLFLGALDCAEIYPDLENMVDYWQCHAGCDAGFVECVEPLDECDMDLALECMDTEQQCEAGCVSSPV